MQATELRQRRGAVEQRIGAVRFGGECAVCAGQRVLRSRQLQLRGRQVDQSRSSTRQQAQRVLVVRFGFRESAGLLALQAIDESGLGLLEAIVCG